MIASHAAGAQSKRSLSGRPNVANARAVWLSYVAPLFCIALFPLRLNAEATQVRFATFNTSLYRSSAGQLITHLSAPGNRQAAAIAEIIQRVNPDVLLLNEFDYDGAGQAIANFQQNVLSIGKNGAEAVHYPYVYLAPSNAGAPSGRDFNHNGATNDPEDALGFGFYPGQYGMVVLSKFPIAVDQARTFQHFLWKDMPGALLPDDPATSEPADWYDGDDLAVLPLSSKSHWDLPIDVGGTLVHVLASHPTPPVFDGPEDRNGRRNHDEIRLWNDYISPGQGDYLVDDAGVAGGLAAGDHFVVMGDLNADPNDGDGFPGAIRALLDNPRTNAAVTPSSLGGPSDAARQGGKNLNHAGDPANDTVDVADSGSAPGNLRLDYVLPSDTLNIASAGVFWPRFDQPQYPLIDPTLSSDHRLVWVDVVVPVPEPTSASLLFAAVVVFFGVHVFLAQRKCRSRSVRQKT